MQGHAELSACLPFMKFLDTALTSLPAAYKYQGNCMRGVKYVYPSPADHDPETYFPSGTEFFWYEFRSASTDPSVMSNEQFCGHDPTEPRTIFNINAIEAYSISLFSEYGEQEREVLFPPLTMLQVSCNTAGEPIQTEETTAYGAKFTRIVVQPTFV